MTRSIVDGAMRFISITPRGAAGSANADARTSTATAAKLAFMRSSLSGTKDVPRTTTVIGCRCVTHWAGAVRYSMLIFYVNRGIVYAFSQSRSGGGPATPAMATGKGSHRLFV